MFSPPPNSFHIFPYTQLYFLSLSIVVLRQGIPLGSWVFVRLVGQQAPGILLFTPTVLGITEILQSTKHFV